MKKKLLFVILAVGILTALMSARAGAVSAQQTLGQNGTCTNYNPALTGSRVGVAKLSIQTTSPSPGWQTVTTSGSFNKLTPNSLYQIGLALQQNGSVTTGCFVPIPQGQTSPWVAFVTDNTGSARVSMTYSLFSGNYGYQVVVSPNADISANDYVTVPSSFNVP